MTQTQIAELKQGLWIEQNWLQEAGLDDKVQIIIQDGEIRILAVTATTQQNQETGWEVFLSLEKNAPTGENANVSTNHDNYLYQK